MGMSYNYADDNENIIKSNSTAGPCKSRQIYRVCLSVFSVHCLCISVCPCCRCIVYYVSVASVVSALFSNTPIPYLIQLHIFYDMQENTVVNGHVNICITFVLPYVNIDYKASMQAKCTKILLFLKESQTDGIS